MKKKFNAPKMKISVFCGENIITDSGVVDTPVMISAEEKAKADLNQRNVTGILNFTY